MKKQSREGELRRTSESRPDAPQTDAGVALAAAGLAAYLITLHQKIWFDAVLTPDGKNEGVGFPPMPRQSYNADWT